MIQEQTSGAGKGLKEQTAMVKAMSRFNWNDSNTKVILPEDIGNYSYTPMQGFEGETEQYFDGEKAWEEFRPAEINLVKGLTSLKTVFFCRCIW